MLYLSIMDDDADDANNNNNDDDVVAMILITVLLNSKTWRPNFFQCKKMKVYWRKNKKRFTKPVKYSNGFAFI